MEDEKITGRKLTAASDVFSKSFLQVSSRKDLVDRLKLLHETIKDMSQDPSERTGDLPYTRAHLISKHILNNPDKEVRLLAACSIMDILRIFAPAAPYE